MIPTNVEEAVLNLYLTCQRAARSFASGAERARTPALRAALRERSQHCRQVAGGLRPLLTRALRSGDTGAAGDLQQWQQLPAHARDGDILRLYEVCEGFVLAGYRDLFDIGLPDGLAALLMPQFERALMQYMEVVSVGRSLRERRAPTQRQVPQGLGVRPAAPAGAPLAGAVSAV
jgi:diadenosine tetraphosphatase ApaH/serine/threonine PP2A family protein phosphatase